jgi:hypothetical protein
VIVNMHGRTTIKILGQLLSVERPSLTPTQTSIITELLDEKTEDSELKSSENSPN